MNKSHHPVVYFEIPVKDLDRAMKFYHLVFGFEFEQDIVDDNQMAFFSLGENAEGMSGALAKGEIYKPTNNGVLIYFLTGNMDKTLQSAISNGGKILFPKTFNEGWGFVAEFEDTEGNRIALKQAL